MATPRTAWHFYFCILLRERGDKSFELLSEVPIGRELPRADYLLLRKAQPSGEDPARSLRGLWPRLPKETVVEFKSTGRPYRKRELCKLLAYGFGYYAISSTLQHPRELACALVLSARNAALLGDLRTLRLVLREGAAGYSSIHGCCLAIHLIELDRVSESEDDDVLRLFSAHKKHTLEGYQWWARWVGDIEMKPQELEGYDEVVQKLLSSLTPRERLLGLNAEERLAGLGPQERLAGLGPQERLAGLGPQERLAGLGPQERLAGLGPQERLAGLAPQQLLLGLPNELLRALNTDYIDSLPAQLRDEIRARLKG